MIVTKVVWHCAGIIGALASLLIGGALLSGETWLRGDEIAFVSYSDLNAEIMLIDVNQGLPFNLTHSPAYDTDPAWSPDGNWLAFASDRDGRRDIYVMDAFGGNVRRLTDSQRFYEQPRWTADGQRLIFDSGTTSPETVYSVDFDGGSLHPLKDPPNPREKIPVDLALNPGDLSLTRAPDGRAIAFMTYRDQSWGIYVSGDASRQHVRLLVKVGTFTGAPVWSPDGRRIAYTMRKGGATNLYVVDVSSGAVRQLIFDHTIDVAPAWRP